MDDSIWIANAVFALLAAFGILCGCWLFSEWLRGTFKQLPQEVEYPEYDTGPSRTDYERAEAELAALARIEAQVQYEAESDSPVETPVPAATTPTTTPEPPTDPREVARTQAQVEAEARIAAMAARHASEVAGEAETTASAARMQAEIQRRAEKAQQERSRPRPGVRSIKEYDFDKELRDDLPRSQRFVDPLDTLPGYL